MTGRLLVFTKGMGSSFWRIVQASFRAHRPLGGVSQSVDTECASLCSQDSRCPIFLEDLPYCLSAFNRPRSFRARFDQRLHRRGIIPFLLMPAVLRTVSRPSERRGLEVVLNVFKLWLMAQDQLDHLRIAMPGGPVQRSSVVLAHTIHGETGL